MQLLHTLYLLMSLLHEGSKKGCLILLNACSFDSSFPGSLPCSLSSHLRWERQKCNLKRQGKVFEIHKLRNRKRGWTGKGRNGSTGFVQNWKCHKTHLPTSLKFTYIIIPTSFVLFVNKNRTSPVVCQTIKPLEKSAVACQGSNKNVELLL